MPVCSRFSQKPFHSSMVISESLLRSISLNMAFVLTLLKALKWLSASLGGGGERRERR